MSSAQAAAAAVPPCLYVRPFVPQEHDVTYCILQHTQHSNIFSSDYLRYYHTLVYISYNLYTVCACIEGAPVLKTHPLVLEFKT